MATIRPATASDYEPFVAMFRELATQDPIPPREVFEATYLPRAFFVCDGEAIVGYGYGQAIGPSWHVMHVVTAPEARGRGVGRRVLEEHARRARAAGVTKWWLNVKRTNAAAIRLYEKVGFAIATSTWAMIIDWADVAKLPAPEAAYETLVVPAALDAQLEAALGLSAGEVASHRARPGRVICGVRAEGAFVGYASFAPAFPGSFPFRPAGPRWVRALFEAMRPHAQPEHANVRMVCEGDEALVKACRDAGGRVLLEMYRMEAALPA